MVDNYTNINNTKESLSNDSQQFLQYQQNRESLKIDGQQFHQYQQNRKLKECWSTIPPISTKQKKA